MPIAPLRNRPGGSQLPASLRTRLAAPRDEVRPPHSVALDDHLGLVLSSGGRLSGILSPAQGIIDPDIMLQMERDWRNVVDQSDAAKRLQLVRAPVKFDRTTLTPQELQIRNLLDGSRDDLLTIWG